MSSGEAVEMPEIGQDTSLLTDDEKNGLSSKEAALRLEKYGRNEVKEKVVPLWWLFLKQFTGIMPVIIEIAFVFALALYIAGLETPVDFIIILVMLLLNAILGFREEYKAQQAMASLRDGIVPKISAKRDGEFVMIEVAEIVPGDILFLKGGQCVPADCDFIEGDEMMCDQAALTGESRPVKVPKDQKFMYSGSILKQGECEAIVRKTGIYTLIGDAAATIQDEGGASKGHFQIAVEKAVNGIIFVSLVLIVILGIYLALFFRFTWSRILMNCLSILIASVPVTLPMVLTVTLASGAASMAKESAIVTHLSALEEISSMNTLCSDKTGTLTMAMMQVYTEDVVTYNGFSKEEVLLYTILCSNKANIDDAIDSGIFRAADKVYGDKLEETLKPYELTKFVGFNAIIKRTVAYLKHEDEELMIGKGLLDKILDTGDDGGVEWTCESLDSIAAEAKKADLEFSQRGFKTIAVSIRKGNGPMQFAGIVPMLDSPRHDTADTIRRVREGGVEVKMITGDHLNIAIETANQIDLGKNIYPNTELWPASAMRDDMIEAADGFAQVLPKDKHEVVAVLQSRKHIVGMTGDGVNDAPALARADIGIAVAGATEAAQAAADIILTEEGLSPIYSAIVASRKIFKRLRSYILYRLASTVMIVAVLCIFGFVWGYDLPSMLVIFLALFNDLVVMSISYDNAVASAEPTQPRVFPIIGISFVLGLISFGQTMVFFCFTPFWVGMTDIDGNAISPTDGTAGLYHDALEFHNLANGPTELGLTGTPTQSQTLMWFQMITASLFMVFPCRTRFWMILNTPGISLLTAVIIFLIILTLCCGFGIEGLFAQLAWSWIGYTFLYNIVWLIVIDLTKATAFQLFDPYHPHPLPGHTTRNSWTWLHSCCGERQRHIGQKGLIEKDSKSESNKNPIKKAVLQHAHSTASLRRRRTTTNRVVKYTSVGL